LDIPPIQTPINGKNDIQFNTIEGSFINGLSTNTPPPEGDRTDLAESLQNYLLNLETLIIRSDSYNPSLDLNPSERIFFKWLKEIGAIRYKNADASKLSSNTLVRFEEEQDNDNIANGNQEHNWQKQPNKITVRVQEQESNHRRERVLNIIW
jgi:hypothetical protein